MLMLREPPKDDNQLELFSAIFTDITTRDSRETMEVPFLSLSKRPRSEPIKYEADGVEVTVTAPAETGIANIWDWDLIMWLLSQLREAVDLGQTVSRQIRFSRWAYLKDVRRRVTGREYQRLEAAIKRLTSTTVETTIRAPAGSRTVIFHWIEHSDLVRDSQGKLSDAIVTLPKWLFEAVTDHRLVLSMHRDYFLLTGGFERWLYRFIRKGAGENPAGWKWKFRTLYGRSGTTQGFKFFAKEMHKIIDNSPLLNYELSKLEHEGEIYLHARIIPEKNDKKQQLVESPEVNFLQLKTKTYEAAKKIAPGLDIYALEQEWQEANERNKKTIKYPDKAFLSWLQVVAKSK